METKKIFPYLLALFGETLIILCWLHFGKSFQYNVIILNIFVTSIIFILFYSRLVIPWIDLNEKSSKEVGYIGSKMFFSLLYAIAAIGAMAYFNTERPLSFDKQILIHCILFFILLLGLFQSYISGNKVVSVYEEEKEQRGRLVEMIEASKLVLSKIDQIEESVPSEIKSKLNEILDELRFLSPCNHTEAIRLEKYFIESMNSINSQLFVIPLNIEEINKKIKDCDRISKERKLFYSN